jgi:gamma-glutamyl hercynylcysteine S-oxide synthase
MRPEQDDQRDDQQDDLVRIGSSIQSEVVDHHRDDQIPSLFAAELERVRQRSHSLTTAVLDDDELLRQHSRLMSPLVWDLAHVGNYEELWLLRAAAGIEPMRPEIDTIYDAFEHPRADRPQLPLLRPSEADLYIRQVRDRVLDTLAKTRLDDLPGRDFLYRMVIQHEHQHDETMLATHQLRRGAAVLAPPAVADPVPTDDRLLPAEVFVPAGEFVMGTSDDPWAYDNERPAHRVDLGGYWIDTTPVPNRAYLAFMDDGGYHRRDLWTAAGWNWRQQTQSIAPAFWTRDGNGWATRRFGRLEPLPPEQPVQHVSWFEADAYARWSGRRLPTEAEWEKAASWDPATGTKRRFPWGDEPYTPRRANLGQQRLGPTTIGAYPDGASPVGARQLLGDVWEWTATAFTGHPGFCVYPYPEYSEVFFGEEYRVLRGGSWATDPVACRNTFRNWDYPIRRQIFTGFRCARDA